MPIEKLLCIFDFAVLLIEFFLVWTSTEIALTHKIIHYVELLYFILKKDQMHNKLYPHYTIYIIFLFCRDMSWMLWFCVNCISGRTWYKIQSNATTKTADRSLQHPFLLSYRLTVTNQYFSSFSFRVICHSRNNTPVWKHIRYCSELLCNSDCVK